MKDRLVRTLQELVEIKSDLRADQSNIVGYVSERLRSMGMDVSLIGPKKLPVLIASSGKGGLLLSGHLDTVPLGTGWNYMQGEIRNGRVYGRGSADMKGGCAAIIESAEELIQNDTPFSICFTTDEEEQMYGAEALATSDVVKNSAGVIICEPTSMFLANCEKGLYRVELTTKGTSAHASQPWLGRDAILKMHYCIDRLVDLVETSSQKKTGTTVCITTIRGGDKNNVITDVCKAEIDIRFESPTVHQDIQDLITNRLRGESYELVPTFSVDAFESDLDSNLGKKLIDHLKTPSVAMPYVTEAPFFARSNKNVFICGPGDPQMAHVIDEFVNISELERAHDFLIYAAEVAKTKL